MPSASLQSEVGVPKNIRHNEIVDLINQLNISQHYIWASMIWGTIAGGYLIYGWKQKSLIPFLGGLVMTVTAIFIFNAWLMSLVSVAIMFAVWGLCKRGY
jgi:hypothetical protein